MTAVEPAVMRDEFHRVRREAAYKPGLLRFTPDRHPKTVEPRDILASLRRLRRVAPDEGIA